MPTSTTAWPRPQCLSWLLKSHFGRVGRPNNAFDISSRKTLVYNASSIARFALLLVVRPTDLHRHPFKEKTSPSSFIPRSHHSPHRVSQSQSRMRSKVYDLSQLITIPVRISQSLGLSSAYIYLMQGTCVPHKASPLARHR